MSKLVSNIVFTRNRPLQLDAYLESLYRHLPPDKIQTYVIYKVDLFDEQYSELFERFADCVVIREKDFHDDFMDLFETLDTEYILFGTDDMIYFDSVDLELVNKTFEKFDDEIFGFTLKFGPETLKATDDTPIVIGTGPERLHKINWKKAKNRHVAYPFDVSCTIYRMDLVREILSHAAKESPLLKKLFARNSARVRLLRRIISMKNFLVSIDTFRNPNELEGYCYRWCKTHRRLSPSYLYFQRFCACPIQVNRVNTAVDNPVCGTGEHTVEALNEKYKQGYKFDISSIEQNKPKSLLVGEQYFKLTKSSGIPGRTNGQRC